MTSSIRLLLEEFIGLMREEGELDAFLPVLLTAMNHEIVFRAQKGNRQFGVDVVSIEKAPSRPPVLCLWLIKCGNIGRTEWNGGAVQAVRPSIDDVETYLSSSIRPEHHGMPIRLIVATNGDFLSTITQDLKTYLSKWEQRNSAKTQMVNGSTIAAWIEDALLSEFVLNGESKSLFRQTLANVEIPELSLASGRQLVDQLIATAVLPAKSKGKLEKQQLHALRAIRTIINVLQLWAIDAGNLTAPYRLAEYAVLSVWANFHNQIDDGNKQLAEEYMELAAQMLNAAFRYHSKLLPYYKTEDAIATRFSDNVLVTDAVFVELGRLSLQGCIWAFLYAELPAQEGLAGVEFYLQAVCHLLESHSVTCSPCYDYHAQSVHATLLFLLVAKQKPLAVNWLGELVGRLEHAARRTEYWPGTATFDDLLQARHGLIELPLEALRISTLLPILLIWTAALDMADVYTLIRERIAPIFPEMSPNLWSSEDGFDALVASPAQLSAHGIAEPLIELPEDGKDLLALLQAPLTGTTSIEESVWYKQRVAYIPLLAAQYWRLQVPREMVVKHVLAVCASVTDT